MAVTSKWSLRTRILLLTSLPAFLMFVIMLAYHVYERLHDAEQEQTRSGMIMATQLAAATDFAIMSGSFDGLVPQVDAILAQPGTASVRVLDANNRLLFSKQHQLPKDEQQQHYTATVYQQTVNLDSNDWLVSDANNNTPKTILGVVDIGFSSAYILQTDVTQFLEFAIGRTPFLKPLASTSFLMRND